MAYYIALRIINRKRKREREALSRRLLKDFYNPFHFDEHKFINEFGMNKKGVLHICDLLGPVIMRKRGIPVEMQIISSLKILRSGTFQQHVGEDPLLSVSQSSISRNMDNFLDAILDIAHRVIEFPSYGELAFTEQKFYGQSKIPNIIGALRCTHVKVNKPHGIYNAMYLNKCNEYSINVQLVCDSNFRILDAVVEWPGSTPNYIIWKKSALRNVLKSNTMPSKSFLVGDNTFPLEPWLLVPYEDCHKTEELIFNDHINRALNIVEACDAIVRTRFKCIHNKSGPLYYSPEKSGKIILACFVLHNICINLGIELNEQIISIEDYPAASSIHPGTDAGMEEILLKNEAISLREEVAKQLSSI